MGHKPKTSKVRRQKRSIKRTTFRELVEGDLSGSLLSTFEGATEKEKKDIEKDVTNLIKINTDFKTYAETPRHVRTNLLQKSIGFILFGV